MPTVWAWRSLPVLQKLTEAGAAYLDDARLQLAKSAAAARKSVAAPGGKAKASKGKGRAPAVKGAPRVGKRRQSR